MGRHVRMAAYPLGSGHRGHLRLKAPPLKTLRTVSPNTKRSQGLDPPFTLAAAIVMPPANFQNTYGRPNTENGADGALGYLANPLHVVAVR